MPEPTLALILFLLPLAYSPGPGNLFFAAIGARFGLRAALPAMTGYHLATFALTAAIGLGFAGLARLAPAALEVMRYAGAAYVLWLALLFLRAGAHQDGAGPGPARALDGAILLVLNPKAWLIIALMFTQFLPAHAGGGASVVLWITAIFTVNNLVAFIVWTVAGDLLTRRFRSGTPAKGRNAAFALMLASVALWMLLR
jgi:threonine/homoserine/homoserine lactone efflux protein